jgi:hypothetical protein
MRERAKFDPEQKSLKFMLEITILVSSVNNIHSDRFFSWEKVIYVYYEQLRP